MKYFLLLNTSADFYIALCSIDNNNNISVIEVKRNEDSSLKVADVLIESVKDIASKNKVSLQEIIYISIITGPGYYTGLRNSFVFAKVLGFSLNIPIIGIDLGLLMQYDFVNRYSLMALDIGKKGAVLALYHNNDLILDYTYIEPFDINEYVDSLLIKYKATEFWCMGSKKNLINNDKVAHCEENNFNPNTHAIASFKKFKDGDFGDISPIYPSNGDNWKT